MSASSASVVARVSESSVCLLSVCLKNDDGMVMVAFEQADNRTECVCVSFQTCFCLFCF